MNDRGSHYELVVRGELGERFGLLFEDMHLECDRGMTVIAGPVLDQAHLHGLIERVRELGLELVSVNPQDGSSPDHDERKGGP